MQSVVCGFKDRSDAGRRLAALLWDYSSVDDVVILALPRGGVPVAAEVSTTLAKPIDVLVVRKLGVPGDEEVAMGAVTSGGVRVMDEDLVARLGIGRETIDEMVRNETAEVHRRLKDYREDRPPPEVSGKRVILVDDGIATGSTVSAAISLLRKQGVGSVVVAVPVAAEDTVRRLREEADDLVVVIESDEFGAVSRWYEDFPQTSDEEVRAILSGCSPAVAVRADGGIPWVFNRSPIQMIRQLARPFIGAETDYDGILDLIGDAGVVVLGAANYGTREFYQARVGITKRLVAEKGFNAVVTEADLVDSWRVNDYLRGAPGIPDASSALDGFSRFPSWVWRNAEFLEFVDWLKDQNDRAGSAERRVGFHGLDLFGLRRSMSRVVEELEGGEIEAVGKVLSLFDCVDRFGRDPHHYGQMNGPEASEAMRSGLVGTLVDSRRESFARLPEEGGDPVDDELLRFVRSTPDGCIADYYGSLFRSYASSWNRRDEKMMELLGVLIGAIESHAGEAKVVVWAHNSHAGDARATEMSWRGDVSLGQLVRERFGERSRLIGMTTYSGEVAASSGWGEEAGTMELTPTPEGSFEKLFHQVGFAEFWMDFMGGHPAVSALKRPRVERGVGVVHREGGGRDWHSYEACIAGQFDALIHCDVTRAVQPLVRESEPSAP